MDIIVQGFLCTYLFILLGKYVEMLLLGHRVSTYLTLWKTARSISKVLLGI